MDNVVEIVDSIKTKITDQEYIDLMGALNSFYVDKGNIPQSIITSDHRTVNISKLDYREYESVRFNIDEEQIGHLSVPGEFYPCADDIYNLSVILDDDITARRTSNGWIIDTVSGTYSKSLIQLELPDGSYGYMICDDKDRKHSILDLPSEIWYTSDGAVKIKKWHNRGTLMHEQEWPDASS